MPYDSTVDYYRTPGHVMAVACQLYYVRTMEHDTPKRKPPPAWWIAFSRVYRRRGLMGHPPWWWAAVKQALGC